MNTLTLQELCIKAVVKTIFKNPVIALDNVIDMLDIPTALKKRVCEEVLKLQEKCHCNLSTSNTRFHKYGSYSCNLNVCRFNYADLRRRRPPKTLTTISAREVAKQICQHPDINLKRKIQSLNLPKIIEREVLDQTWSEVFYSIAYSDNKRFNLRMDYYMSYYITDSDN